MNKGEERICIFEKECNSIWTKMITLAAKNQLLLAQSVRELLLNSVHVHALRIILMWSFTLTLCSYCTYCITHGKNKDREVDRGFKICRATEIFGRCTGNFMLNEFHVRHYDWQRAGRKWRCSICSARPDLSLFLFAPGPPQLATEASTSFKVALMRMYKNATKCDHNNHKQTDLRPKLALIVI